MKRAVLLIDGGYLRVNARNGGNTYNPDFIETFAHCCPDDSEELLKVLYYDCRPYNGEVQKPISGETQVFENSGNWLRDLSSRDLFAVREGQLKFRGWIPKKIPVSTRDLSDADFRPDLEQKGVDMRIGIDMARLAQTRQVERVLLVSADTDMIPAMKEVRAANIQVVLCALPVMRDRDKLRDELKAHADYVRPVTWPTAPVVSPSP